MTVSATTSRADYTGNGSTTAFTVPFYFLDSSHLTVLRTQVSTGAITTLALTTDYTVSGAGVSAGGTVTCVTAPTTDQKLSILRNVPLTQLVHYVPNDPFPAATHEQALDQLTMEMQQVNEIAGRALTLPANTPSGTVSASLPSPSSNKLIGWNATATGLQNIDQTTLATIVAFGTSNADVFTGTGAQTAFTLTANPGAQANLDVSIGGVTQTPGVDYLWVSGTTVTFTTAPPNGAKILVRYFQALPQGTTDSAASTFLQSGTGAVTRNVQAKSREWVSPEDFGAVGDGTTNDTTALQNALNTGKTVRGTPGATYYINPLTQSTARQVIDMRGCTLKLRPSQSSYMLSLSGAGAQVFGGVWDGNKAAGQSTASGYYDHAAVCISADYCRVDGIKSQNSAGIGIKGSLCNYALVLNNEVTGWNIQGIYLESVTADAFGNRIENNVVTVGLNTGVGIYITGSNSPFTYKQKRWVVANNIVTGPTNPAVTDIGITCRAVDGVVSGNVVVDCDLGVTLDITSRTAVTGNRVEFTGSPVTGYCYEINGADNTFSGNISKGGKYGYVSSGALSCDGNNITGNVFELQTINAIYFTTSGGNTANYLTISGNTFNFAAAGASRRAIYLTGDCRYSTITGNNFIGPGSGTVNGRGVFLDTGYGELQICNNRFQGWERPVSLYSPGASTYNNVLFAGNDCSKDMLSDANWIGLEGSAAYGNGIKQLWNSAGGYQEVNYINRANNLVLMWNGSGTPEGLITAAVGSMYLNTAGGAGTVLYVKQTGTGNTGWGAK